MASGLVVEDLEYNDFYVALQTQFQALYERAQAECWLVCIPCGSSLPPTNQINFNFVSAHLLEPSKLLRDEYYTLVGGKRKKWQLVGDKLIAEDDSLQSCVLSEELAYNRSFKQYRIFVIDRPLVGGTHKRKSKTAVTKEDMLVPRQTLEENMRLLECFSRHNEIKQEIDKRIEMFRENYMVLEGFLSDAASRLEGLVKQAFSSYVLEHKSDKRMQDRRVQEMVWLALESYIIYEVHPKVFPKICNRHKKEDRLFSERCKQLRSHLKPSQLGISKDYDCPYSLTIKEFKKLIDCQSSVEKLYCLSNALDYIHKDVQNYFKASLRLGDPAPLPSDDLISLLATIIVQVDLSMLHSDMYYVEQFHWPFSDGDKLSFVIVTIRASLEYIKGPDVDKYIPKSDKHRTQPTKVSSTSWSRKAESSLPPSLLELHKAKEDPPPLNETLAKLSRLQVTADKMESSSSGEEGSFFSKLMENDGVLSSVDM